MPAAWSALLEPSAIVVEVTRICAWLLVLALCFVPLERLFGRREQPLLRPGLLRDVGYFLLNGLLPKAMLAAAVSAVAWLHHDVLHAGVLPWAAGLPAGVRFAFALLVAEFGAYWAHRWMHSVPILWRLHAVHHRAEQMDWLVNTRAHPLDIVFSRLCAWVPVYALGLAQPTAESFDLVPILVVIFGTVWSFVIHANLRVRFGWLEGLISTPHFHHWHHHRIHPGESTKNYAALLPAMDRLFGTYFAPNHAWPSEVGSVAAQRSD